VGDIPVNRIVVSLIEPPILFSGTQVSAHVMIPIAVASLASYLDSLGTVDVQVIDAPGEALDRVESLGDGRYRRGLALDEIVRRVDPNTQLIGIRNAFSFAFSTVAELAGLLKAAYPDVPIVAGGDNASALTEFMLENSRIDYVAIGEGEATFASAVDAVRNGASLESIDGLAMRVQDRTVVNPRPRAVDIDILPLPNYEQVRLDRYHEFGGAYGPTNGKWMPMLSSRGCPGRCKFCTSPFMWQRLLRARSPSLVVDEMIHWRRTLDIDDIHFYDLNFGYSPDWFGSFLEECRRLPEGLSWQLVTGIRPENINKDTARVMAERGCAGISVAPETYSEELRLATDKKMGTDAVFNAVELLSRNGISTNAYFLIGIPGETRSDLKRLPGALKKMARLGLDDIGISVLKLLPGSVYFDQSLDSGGIDLDIDFLDKLVFQSDLDVMDCSATDIDAEVLRKAVLDSHISFFAWKFAYHPRKLAETLLNALTGRETTRLDRVLRTRRVELARTLTRSISRRLSRTGS